MNRPLVFAGENTYSNCIAILSPESVKGILFIQKKTQNFSKNSIFSMNNLIKSKTKQKEQQNGTWKIFLFVYIYFIVTKFEYAQSQTVNTSGVSRGQGSMPPKQKE